MRNSTVRVVAICFFILLSKTGSSTYSWERMSDFGGGLRTFPFGFSIGNYGYAGCGKTTTDNNDFWQYDPTTNTWTQMANYPGLGRFAMVGFSIGNSGYAGTGWTGPGGAGHQYNDFWSYNPSNNSWTQKTDFPGVGRYGAVGFVIGDKGYVGLGYIPFNNDFWEYDPSNDSWAQKMNFPGSPRTGAVGLAIGNFGYVGTGYSANGNEHDFYQFDPVNNSWTAKMDVPGLRRRNAAAFSIGNYGYVGMGFNDTTYHTDFYQYNPSINQWATVASIGGVPRYGCFSFVIDNYGYVGVGAYYTLTDPIFTDEFWRFGDCDGSPVGMIQLPTSHENISMSVAFDQHRGLVLEYDIKSVNGPLFSVYNSLGQQVLTSILVPAVHSTFIPANLAKDVYFYSVTDNEKRLAEGKVIVN